MVKFLIFLAFIFGLFYFFYYKIKRFLIDIFNPSSEESTNAKSSSINKGEMVKCPRCGTYFPENTGIRKRGKIYCSNECALKDEQ